MGHRSTVRFMSEADRIYPTVPCNHLLIYISNFKNNFSLSWIWRWSDVDNSTWKWSLNGKKSRFKFSSFQFRYGSQCCRKCSRCFWKFTSVRIFNPSSFKVSSIMSYYYDSYYMSQSLQNSSKSKYCYKQYCLLWWLLDRSWSESWVILNDSFINPISMSHQYESSCSTSFGAISCFLSSWLNPQIYFSMVHRKSMVHSCSNGESKWLISSDLSHKLWVIITLNFV